MLGNPPYIGIGEKRARSLTAIGALQAIGTLKFFLVQLLHQVIEIFWRSLFEFGKELSVFCLLFLGLGRQLIDSGLHGAKVRIGLLKPLNQNKAPFLRKPLFMDDLLGKALLDYQMGRYTEDIRTFSSLDEKDVMPLPHLFRSYAAMPELEKKALDICRGKVLDIGCGAGSHGLYLQKQGFDVTALDASAGAIAVCSLRGVEKTVRSSILAYSGTKFDTLLLMMNGIGIVGKLERLDAYLRHFKNLLKADGQLLLDSSDIIYMYDEDEDGGPNIPEPMEYYGEVSFVMEYQGKKSNPFDWLYLDYNTLENAAIANGFECKLIGTGTHYDYLAQLTPLA